MELFKHLSFLMEHRSVKEGAMTTLLLLQPTV